jgi:hypothetical protein
MSSEPYSLLLPVKKLDAAQQEKMEALKTTGVIARFEIDPHSGFLAVWFPWPPQELTHRHIFEFRRRCELAKEAIGK